MNTLNSLIFMLLVTSLEGKQCFSNASPLVINTLNYKDYYLQSLDYDTTNNNILLCAFDNILIGSILITLLDSNYASTWNSHIQ